MSRYEAEPEITLSFEEARVTYLTVADALDAAPADSELRVRLAAVGSMLRSKMFPDYPNEDGDLR